MKKTFFHKVAVITLICAMTVACLAGCGKKKEGSVDWSSIPNKTAGIEGWSAFEQKVELKVPVYNRGAAGIDSVQENGLTKWVQENFGDKYNINLTFVPITRSDVMKDYSLLAAAGDLPTFLMEYDYPKVTQWAEDGYLQTIDLDVFKNIAPTYYNRMVELNQLAYTKVNNETYFVLAERPYYNTTYTYVTFVRMDWLRQVGYDHVPANYAEYCDAMDKIIKAGIAEHPAGGRMLTDAYVPNFGFRDYPVKEEEWAMYSSLGTASLSWNPTYKYIKRKNAEYNKGYINPEYAVTDSETEKANFINGKTYAYGGYMSVSVDWLTSFYAANPNAELAIASVYTDVEKGVVDFPQIRSDNPYGMTIGFASSASADELKAAMMYMEWCTQKDVLYKLQHSSDIWNNFNNSKDFWCVTIESVKEGTIEDTIAAITPQGIPQNFTNDMINNYYELKKIADAGHAYTDPAFSISIAAESESNATLLSLYIEYYDKLVQCDPAKFDELYKEYSDKYLKSGYQAIIDERLAGYKAGKTTKLPWNK